MVEKKRSYTAAPERRQLRVVAVAAPELPSGGLGAGALTSSDPASLYNALRYAAQLAEEGLGAWGSSNWVGSRRDRQSKVLLMHTLKEGAAELRALLQREEPNLLFIGAMTVCLPGAIAVAQIAREVLGSKVCIVLGGRHVTETMYLDSVGSSAQSQTRQQWKATAPVLHHNGSPLRLIAEGFIEPVFDLVIAGEGEHIIAGVGEMIGASSSKSLTPTDICTEMKKLCRVPGRWIAGCVNDRKINEVVSNGFPIDRNQLPSPAAMFGINTAFEVFEGRLTAHAFSDTGSGCIFDCGFCSERRSVAGPLVQLDTSSDRLFNQFKSIVKVVEEDSPDRRASAFVEDSTLLAGSPFTLPRFVDLLANNNLDITFGGQMTIDQVVTRKAILRSLRDVGLRYLFIGLETIDPNAIGGMSKDVKSSTGEWVSRAEIAFEMLYDLDIVCGVALLFGLGESRAQRRALFEQLNQWRQRFGFPNPISLNWAVQHPLKGNDGGTGYRYHEWSVPEGEFLDAFRDFGEASVRYPVAGQPAPTIDEVLEIQRLYRQLVFNGGEHLNC